MKTTKFVLSFLLLTICITVCSLLFTGCDFGYVDITGLDITTSSELSIYTNETVKNLTVKVAAGGKWRLSDVNVVIGDESIIKIDYDSDASDKKAINFNIQGLKKGTTAFFFETADKTVRSNMVIVSVGSAYSSIEFKDSEDIILRGLADEAEVSFLVLRGDRAIECPVDVQIISENPEVVEIVYTGHRSGMDTCAIIPRSYGASYVYIQSPDGEIMSEKIKVLVIHGEDEEPLYFVLNTNTKKIHQHSCYIAKKLGEDKRLDVWGSLEYYFEQGYTECGTCFDSPDEPEDSLEPEASEKNK